MVGWNLILKRLLTFGLGSILFFQYSCLGGGGSQTTPKETKFDAWLRYTGSTPEAVAIGDINQDALNDLVLGTSSWNDRDPYNLNNCVITFFQNQDADLLLSQIEPGVSGYVRSLEIGDLDGDGKNDIVSNSFDGLVVYYQNNAGTINSWITITTPNFPTIARMGDFNGDGKKDLAVIYHNVGRVELDVFHQNTDGTFNQPITFIMEHDGYDNLEVADFNNDSLDDLIVGFLGGPNAFAVLLQDSSGNLINPVYYDLGNGMGIWDIAIDDLDDDGNQDILVTYGTKKYNDYDPSPPAGLAIFIQNNLGYFEMQPPIELSEALTAIELADFNGDGKEDLVGLSSYYYDVRIFVFEGITNWFVEEESYRFIGSSAHYPSRGLATGDINNDGLIDIIYANNTRLTSNFDETGLVLLYNKGLW